jgi:hypothetical protein
MKQKQTQLAADATLATGLLSSPFWGQWLTQFNDVLTAITLVIGIVLGVSRLWAFWRDQRHRRNEDKAKRSRSRLW